MKLLNRRVQFMILGLWVPVVLLLFKLIEDRSLAAVLAGVGFIVWPLLFLVLEFKFRSFTLYSKIHRVGCLQFLILFAIPLFAVRILNWGVPFSELSLAGVRASTIHQYSNGSYLIMIIMVAMSSYEDLKKKNR